MCGRFVSKIEAALEREWALRRPPPLFSSYNVAPTQDVPVVRLDDEGEREAVMVRWGLIPFWAKGQTPKYSTINATAERLQTAPVYRGSWKHGRRCLFPVNGFYEWQVVEGQKAKQPWFIRLPDQALFALGGLWDRSQDDDGSAVESATIVTMPANDLLAEIHNTKQRMPLVIPPEAFADWLGPDAAAAQDRIAAFPASRMQAWPVSTYVNKPANDDQRCIASTDPRKQ